MEPISWHRRGIRSQRKGNESAGRTKGPADCATYKSISVKQIDVEGARATDKRKRASRGEYGVAKEK